MDQRIDASFGDRQCRRNLRTASRDSLCADLRPDDSSPDQGRRMPLFLVRRRLADFLAQGANGSLGG